MRMARICVSGEKGEEKVNETVRTKRYRKPPEIGKSVFSKIFCYMVES